MSTAAIKNKISKSLEVLDAKQLQSAYLILQELAAQKKYAIQNIDKNIVSSKIAKGIQQLDNGEGTDFGSFLNEMQAAYGKKK
ncbi:MAG TPA: hypothetical protein VGP43_11720 [Chitinophagaceae bacterium]|nr:hypothetical protein [Chitinophagaceae bacterium]